MVDEQEVRACLGGAFDNALRDIDGSGDAAHRPPMIKLEPVQRRWIFGVATDAEQSIETLREVDGADGHRS